MIFAKIDYINLLPFYIFIKKYISNSQIKSIINHKKSYPSDINKKFTSRKVDAAFISSIVAKNKNTTDIGIVAKDDVLSVLVLKNKPNKNDYQSDTSNRLAKILGIDGEIIIGDKALKLYLRYQQDDRLDEVIDLAKEWKNRYKNPFVFAILCYNRYEKYINNLAKRFVNSNIKIPQYILNRYSQKTGISKKDILLYLEKISYKIGKKEKKSIKKFQYYR
jgi:chorismate dehydratase